MKLALTRAIGALLAMSAQTQIQEAWRGFKDATIEQILQLKQFGVLGGTR